jgi:hypothetical protein
MRRTYPEGVGKILVGAIIISLIVVAAVVVLSSLVKTSPSPTPTPLTPNPMAGDPCHVNSVTYCALNPDVTQSTIKSTICVSGWTATIRPPVSYTNPLKAQQLAKYAYLHPNDPNWTMAGTEEDHRVPLELGGAPSDPNNLSPEDHPGSFTKDAAENKAKSDVCNGRLTLIEAQTVFIKTYLDPYPGYIFPG